MLFAQIAPLATPAAAAPAAAPTSYFIVGDIKNIAAKAPEDWGNIAIHAIGYVALAYLAG